MDSKFNNGFKTVAVFVQMVCLIIVIVVTALMVNLFGRSRLSFRDIGSDYSFFHSYHFAEEISGEIKTLTLFLQMKELDPDYTKYKQYRLRYDGGESNLYYWLLRDGAIVSNMPEEAADTKEGAKAFAEKMGSYLYYNDETVHLDGDLARIGAAQTVDFLRLFQNREEGELYIAVDVSLSKKDAIADAAEVYETYFPWIGMGLIVAVLSFLCFLLVMIYLTLAAGRNEKDDRIHLHRIDYLPTEILFLFLCFFIFGLIAFCVRLGGKDWGISSALILTGTLVFLSDAVILTLYLSFVRKIKAEQFMSCSLTVYTVHTLKACMQRQDIARRTKIQFGAYGLLVAFFVWEAFAGRHVWAAAALFFLFAYLSAQFLQQAVWRKKILEGVRQISHGTVDYQLNSREFGGDYRELAEEINGIGEGLMHAVEENTKNERLKTELVTNVSHDIKTPLTSIINYVSLIKMEGSWNENVENYVGILEKKSQRLKQLTEDLVEVSQITTGNIMLDMQPINMVELIYQTGGEFNELFEEAGLTVITRLPKEPVMVLADGSRVWRVVQNLYNNVAKYAMRDTRVFVELKVNDGYGEFSIKDISAQEIQKSAKDLSGRFVRGDESRQTEGSGLGLSIAENLTKLMGGTFEIALDGDLFTVSITFPVINP